MKHARPVLVVAVLGLVLLPSSAQAGGRRVFGTAPHGSAVFGSSGPVFFRPRPHGFVASKPNVFFALPGPVVVHPRSKFFAKPNVFAPIVPLHHFSPQHHFFPPHRFFPKFGGPVIVTRPFFPSVVSVPQVIVNSPPVVYATPPPVVSLTPSPLPTSTLIEYPTGWYQLRGDGVTTPYVWVWIPKPPPPPPSEAPPAAPPAPLSEAPADLPALPPVQPQSLAPRSELYRWTDEQGVAHWTDRREKIPEPYRAKAQRHS